MELSGFSGAGAYLAYMRLIRYLPFLVDSEIISVKGKTFSVLIEEFKGLDDDMRKLVITELLSNAPIDEKDIMLLLKPQKDKNGMGITRANINNFSGFEILKMCTQTIFECSNHGEDFFSWAASK